MATDYFRFKRERVWMDLDEGATLAKFDGKTPTFESPDWHPHVIMEPRPTFGARRFIRDMEAELPVVRKKVRAALDVKAIKARINEMEVDAFQRYVEELAKEDINISTRHELAELEIAKEEIQAPELLDVGRRVMLARVAICIADVGGDWNCYINPGKVEWPELGSNDALERRMKVLEGLAHADLVKLNKRAIKSLEVDEDERGKSN